MCAVPFHPEAMRDNPEQETEGRAGGTTSPGVTIRLQSIPWVPVIYGLLILLAVIMRLWDLDSRAYHYDETIHAFSSWVLFQGGDYIHSPWSHGPFLYEVSAAGFLVFGDNLVAPRIFPALFGAALVTLPIFLRSYLGRWGMLFTAAFLAFSPSLLYFSRFARNDILNVAFDLGLVIALWRFIDTRRSRYLYLAAALLVLSFSSKETAYLSLVTVGSYLAAWWARGWLPILWSKSSRKLARLRVRFTPSRFPPHGGFLLLMVLLTLPLFSALLGVLVDKLPLGLDLVNLTETDTAGRVGAPSGGAGDYAAAGIITGGVFIVSLAIGLLWRPKLFLIAFGGFYAVFFLLHTTFLTNMVGMGTGVWQSLGYWIAQQPVERAGQPWYYYFIQLSVYEFLPFTFGLAAVIAFSIKLGRRFLGPVLLLSAISILTAAAIYLTTESKALYIPLAAGLVAVTYLALARGNKFDWFLVHWALMSLLLYTVAGEKMPWLLTHIALPFAVLAGRFVGGLVESVPWRATLRNGGLALLLAAPLLTLALFAMVTSVPWGASPIGGWSFIGALGFTLALLVGAVLLWLRLGSTVASRLVAVSLIGLMGFFTLRAGLQATYENGDDPKEPLVYSQVSADVPRVIDRIEQVAWETGKGRELSILADISHAALAPWRWYLRDFDEVQYVDMNTYDGEIDKDVVLIAAANDHKMRAVQEQYGEGQRIPFLQWFNPWVYGNYTAGAFFRDFASATSWNEALRFFVYREMGTEPAVQDAVVYFAREIS